MDLLFIAILLAAVWFWWSSAQSRETAVKLARRACKQCGVQLLDETVSVTKLRLQRNSKGHINIARWYSFEFSTSGHNRRSGLIGLLGHQLTSMHLDVDTEELPQ